MRFCLLGFRGLSATCVLLGGGFRFQLCRQRAAVDFLGDLGGARVARPVVIPRRRQFGVGHVRDLLGCDGLDVGRLRRVFGLPLSDRLVVLLVRARGGLVHRLDPAECAVGLDVPHPVFLGVEDLDRRLVPCRVSERLEFGCGFLDRRHREAFERDRIRDREPALVRFSDRCRSRLRVTGGRHIGRPLAVVQQRFLPLPISLSLRGAGA